MLRNQKILDIIVLSEFYNSSSPKRSIVSFKDRYNKAIEDGFIPESPLRIIEKNTDESYLHAVMIKWEK